MWLSTPSPQEHFDMSGHLTSTKGQSSHTRALPPPRGPERVSGIQRLLHICQRLRHRVNSPRRTVLATPDLHIRLLSPADHIPPAPTHTLQCQHPQPDSGRRVHNVPPGDILPRARTAARSGQRLPQPAEQHRLPPQPRRLARPVAARLPHAVTPQRPVLDILLQQPPSPKLERPHSAWRKRPDLGAERHTRSRDPVARHPPRHNPLRRNGILPLRA